MGGVGSSSQICNRKIILVGGPEDGRSLVFKAPILDIHFGNGRATRVPFLRALSQFANDNSLFCSRIGRLYLFPAGR